MQPDDDIVGNAVRDTWNTATARPRKAMQAVSDAASNAVDRVKSLISPKQDTVYDNRGSKFAPSTSSTPAPKAAPSKPAKMPSYKSGTDYVPKTGPAKLHKGEAVLPKHEAAEHRKEKMTKVNGNGLSGVASELGGDTPKPKKEIKHIVTKKAKTGGYIHEHHHTHPEHHPMEEHVTPDQDSMMDHMMQHMGTPNPGEAEADAGQSGAGQAPGMGSPTPSGGPTAGM